MSQIVENDTIVFSIDVCESRRLYFQAVIAQKIENVLSHLGLECAVTKRPGILSERTGRGCRDSSARKGSCCVASSSTGYMDQPTTFE